MIVDKEYCLSSFLTFRYFYDKNILLRNDIHHRTFIEHPKRKFTIKTVEDIDNCIRHVIDKEVDSNTGILLSSGIDSAILAAYLKPGTKAYTLKCLADGAIDETPLASKYAKKYKLDHTIIHIRWKDYQELAPLLMKNQGSPIHSIGPQLLKAIQVAKADGITSIISGYAADKIFGGQDRILGRDRKLKEFISWYTHVNPTDVLKKSVSMMYIFEKFLNKTGVIDVKRFINNGPLGIEGSTSFNNAFFYSRMKQIKVYENMVYPHLDIEKIRNGESKYMLKELFKKLYPDFDIPQRIPLPRAMTQWLNDWKGPSRKEFKDGCIKKLNTGDKKWIVYCLEWYLNLIDN